MIDHEYLSVKTGNPDPFSNINLMTAVPGFSMEEHTHPFYHVNRILTGTLTVSFAGETYTLDAGCIFVLPPERPHALYSADGYTQIGIDVERVGDSRGIAAEVEAMCYGFVMKKIPISSHDAQAKIAYMRDLLSHPTKGNQMRAVNLAEGQVLDLLEAMRSADSDNFPEQFAAMLSVRTPWKLKLSDMCQLLCLSRTQLERKARHHFGCGAIEYCARLRYARVCELLKSELTLERIAEQADFCDSCHLSKFFSQRAGMTPGEYRRAIK